MSCNLVKGSSLILQINFRTVFCLIPSTCIHVYVYRKLAPDLVLYIYTCIYTQGAAWRSGLHV